MIVMCASLRWHLLVTGLVFVTVVFVTRLLWWEANNGRRLHQEQTNLISRQNRRYTPPLLDLFVLLNSLNYRLRHCTNNTIVSTSDYQRFEQHVAHYSKTDLDKLEGYPRVYTCETNTMSYMLSAAICSGFPLVIMSNDTWLPRFAFSNDAIEDACLKRVLDRLSTTEFYSASNNDRDRMGLLLFFNRDPRIMNWARRFEGVSHDDFATTLQFYQFISVPSNSVKEADRLDGKPYSWLRIRSKESELDAHMPCMTRTTGESTY